MNHFSIKELEKSDTASRLGINNAAPPEVRAALENLVICLLDPLREAYGGPIYVNSGYRCPKLNAAVKGAANSQHMRGEAADIDTRKGPLENAKLFKLIRERFDYDQLIDEKNYSWVHVSFKSPKKNRHQTLHLK